MEMFKIMATPKYDGGAIPMELARTCEVQIKKNHGQTLERLNERGGLSPAEFWCAYNGKECVGMPGDAWAAEWITTLIKGLSAKNVMLEIQQERARQESKWGIQNHNPFVWLSILGEEVGEANKAVLDSCQYKNGIISNIDRQKLKYGKGCLREELIQVAAVAVAFVEAMDRDQWEL